MNKLDRFEDAYYFSDTDLADALDTVLGNAPEDLSEEERAIYVMGAERLFHELNDE